MNEKILEERNLSEIKLASIFKGEGRKESLDQIIFNDKKIEIISKRD